MNQIRSNLLNAKNSNQTLDVSLNNLPKTKNGKEYFPCSLKRGEIRDHGRQNFQLFIDSSTLSSISNKSDVSLSNGAPSNTDLSDSKNNLPVAVEKPLRGQPSGRVQIIKAIV